VHHRRISNDAEVATFADDVRFADGDDVILRRDFTLDAPIKIFVLEENAELMSEVERVIQAEREIAVNSPMPTPESAEGGVYCEDGCHEIKPKYGMPKVKKGTGGFKATEAAVHLK